MLKYRTDRPKGFTFIELLFVIAIIAVIVGVAQPQLKAAFIRIRFNDFCAKLQSLMNYTHGRSVVEQELLCLVIDKKNGRYWTENIDLQKKDKIYSIPEGIDLETDSERVFFYPSADIDKVTIKIKAQGQKDTLLTTKGVFGGVRIQAR